MKQKELIENGINLKNKELEGLKLSKKKKEAKQRYYSGFANSFDFKDTLKEVNPPKEKVDKLLKICSPISAVLVIAAVLLSIFIHWFCVGIILVAIFVMFPALSKGGTGKGQNERFLLEKEFVEYLKQNGFGPNNGKPLVDKKQKKS